MTKPAHCEAREQGIDWGDKPGHELEPCYERPAVEIQGRWICQGCADALEIMSSIMGTVYDAQPDDVRADIVDHVAEATGDDRQEVLKALEDVPTSDDLEGWAR